MMTDVAVRPAHWRRRRLLWPYLREFGRYATLLPFLLIFTLPFVWYASMALKSAAEIAVNPIWLPIDPQWTNFVTAWNQGRFSVYLPNTIIYSTSITLGVCALSSMAGYAVARLRFPGQRLVMVGILVGIAVPFQSLMIPLFYLARDLGMLGTRWGLIIPMIAVYLPFGTFLMSAFYRSIPNELADAARIDGCNEWAVFWRVMLPLARPGVVTLAIFQFVFSWALFLPALVLAQTDGLRPVALALLLFTGRYSSDRGLIAAAVLLTIIPIIVIYIFAQRRLIEGFTAGAVK